MNTCKRCGTEFDGKFCPECGQRFTDKDVCPKCGNEIADGAKYCPECGQCIVTNDEGEHEGVGTPAIAVRIYSVLRYVPIVLAVLFAVLLPLLYIAPIAEANEMLGAASINIYSLDEGFFGVSVAFLVFMCLAFLLIFVLMFTILGKKRASIVDAIALSAVILIYLPCLIISAVAMGLAAELNEMLGGELADVVSAGAAPKAVLSFSVIFMVFAVGAVVARVLLGKANPELRPDVEVSESSKVQPCRRPLLYFAYLNIRLRYAATAFFFCTFISAIVLLGCLWGGFSYEPVISPHWVIVACASVTVVTVILSQVVGFPEWDPKYFLYVVEKKTDNVDTKFGIKKIILVIIPLIMMIITLIILNAMSSITYERSYSMAVVYIVISIAVYVAAKIVIAVQSGRIAEYLYGYPGPHPNSQLRIEYDEKREQELYNAYKLAKKQGAVVDGESTKTSMRNRRIVLAVACFVFAAASVICAAVSPLFVDKFSASYVSTCVNSTEYLNCKRLFGQPNEVKKDSGGYEVSIYYEDNYVDIMKQLEKAQNMHDMNKVQMLNNKIANLAFCSLLVYEENKDNPRLKIVLNTNTTVRITQSQKKTVDSVELHGARYDVGRGYVADGFYAEIFYTDGSYKYEYVSTSEFSQIDFNKNGKQTVKWSDEWGSYEATVKSA